MLKAVIAILLIAAVTAFAAFFFYCPCDRTPGGWLLGTEVEQPVGDWSFANAAPLCQIEVKGWLPHSVNLNCMATPDGSLYLSCAQCDGKTWSTRALADPRGRIRIDAKVYPVHMERVTDPSELDAAWHARAAKLGRPPDPRPEHWWSFRLASR